MRRDLIADDVFDDIARQPKEKLKTDRSLKELLQLVHDELKGCKTFKEHRGLCHFICALGLQNLITKSECDILDEVLIRPKLSIFERMFYSPYHDSYWFKEGSKYPRLRWLKKRIKALELAERAEKTPQKLLEKQVENLKIIISNKSLLEQKVGRLENENSNLKQGIMNLALNFSCKRFIVGKKTTGKTTLIKNMIMSMTNYFIFDFCNEYKNVPAKNKYVPTDNIDVREINAILRKNKNNIIIIDCVELLPTRVIMNLILEHNFIIASQSKKRIEKYLSGANVVYDLGTLDEFSKGIITDGIDVFQLDQRNFSRIID